MMHDRLERLERENIDIRAQLARCAPGYPDCVDVIYGSTCIFQFTALKTAWLSMSEAERNTAFLLSLARKGVRDCEIMHCHSDVTVAQELQLRTSMCTQDSDALPTATHLQDIFVQQVVLVEGVFKTTDYKCTPEVLSHSIPHYKGLFWTVQQTDDLPEEVWACPRDAKLRGLEISNQGRVKSKCGVCSYGWDTPDGYKKVTINKKGYSVHRIVALVFVGHPPSVQHTVDHIDRCPSNNDVRNLRWATTEVQAVNKGNACPIEAICLVSNNVIGCWPTIAEAARANGMHRDGLYMLLKRTSSTAGLVLFRKA